MADSIAHSPFSMSAFEAAFAIHQFRLLNPTLTNAEIEEALRSIASDLYALDYSVGHQIESLVQTVDGQRPFFRALVDELVTSLQPAWVRFTPGGREHALRAMDSDTAQCLRSAGLLESNEPDVLDWWDALASKVRADRDQQNLKQGRLAERKSFDRERKRVAELGILQTPRWVAIEDNREGFDILSFDLIDGQVRNLPIEVKSCAGSPCWIHLTRHEWDRAIEIGDAYRFHVWDMSADRLIEITLSEMAKSVPVDQGGGRWDNVRVLVS